MKILLVYPSYPDTFWGFKHSLKFTTKKTAYPPLGLLTVASLLPKDWELKLVDLNVKKLKDEDIIWADYVFISAMSAQKASTERIVKRCQILGVKTVGGGPLFTSEPDNFPDIDYLVLNEAEITLPSFLTDLAAAKAQKVYRTTEMADITKTPLPRWDLIDPRKYLGLNVQYSRGCPFDCEFCDITALYGRVPRTKTKEQVIAELDALCALNWRGQVFFVDDNFIGNRVKLKTEILPAIIEWMAARKNPFCFITEASINLADDDELLKLMAQAGFDSVFIGIETPDTDSLAECGKLQNQNRDLLAGVKKIQQAGFQVYGGFIVGFDSDQESTFARVIKFVQESGIVTAMVGLLCAPRGTRLYKRLSDEGRILNDMTGDNTDFSLNFIPKMNQEKLLEGYRRILKNLYSPKSYYQRVKTFMREYQPLSLKRNHKIEYSHFKAFFKSVWKLGLVGRERKHYWQLFFWTLFKKPSMLPLAVTFAIKGFHFRKIFKKYI